jgi:hypothetical protein
LDAMIQTNSAAGITNQLIVTSTVPPATGGTARWNESLQLAQTRPAGVAATLLMATLQNATGGGVSHLYLSYDFTTGAETGLEEIPGYRLYYSYTGAPGDWIAVPELSSRIVTGAHGAYIALEGGWAPQALLYLLWADDNSDAVTDPYLTIDNFSVGTVVCDSFYWLQPFSDLTVTEGEWASFSVNLCPHEQFDFQWFKDGVAIPGATSNTIVFPRAGLADAGSYYTSFSRHATLTVLPDNQPPRALIAWQREDADPLTDLVVVRFSERMDMKRAASLGNGWLEGGSNGVAFVYSVSTTDETNLVLEVDPLEKGARYTLTLSNLIDQAAGTNLLSPNPTVLEVQRFETVISENQVWRYWEAPPETNYLAWTNPGFDDNAWPSGLGAFGFPLDEVLPPPHAVQTVIRCASCGGPITTWFRTVFDLTEEQTNAVVQLRGVFDDGAVVYVNGSEVWRVRLRAGAITTSTTASNSIEPHQVVGPVEIYVPGLLREGQNTLAVEVHQSSVVNGDVIMGLSAQLSRRIPRPELTIEGGGGTAVTVRWKGAGVLQMSPVLDGPPGSWQDVLTSTNRFTTNAVEGMLFFRVRE